MRSTINFSPHLQKLGKIFKEGINKILITHCCPIECVGLPSCSILTNRKDISSPADADALSTLFRAAYRSGVSLYNVNYINYSMTEADVIEALERISSGLANGGR